MNRNWIFKQKWKNTSWPIVNSGKPPCYHHCRPLRQKSPPVAVPTRNENWHQQNTRLLTLSMNLQPILPDSIHKSLTEPNSSRTLITKSSIKPSFQIFKAQGIGALNPLSLFYIPVTRNQWKERVPRITLSKKDEIDDIRIEICSRDFESIEITNYKCTVYHIVLKDIDPTETNNRTYRF